MDCIERRENFCGYGTGSEFKFTRVPPGPCQTKESKVFLDLAVHTSGDWKLIRGLVHNRVPVMMLFSIIIHTTISRKEEDLIKYIFSLVIEPGVIMIQGCSLCPKNRVLSL